jgi:hypothetical protein
MDQMAILLVLMHVYALVLMHAYPSAYAYWVDYVLFTLLPDYAHLSCLQFLMVAYPRLCIFVYLLMVYHIKRRKNLLGLYGMEERKVVRRNYGMEGDLCI